MQDAYETLFDWYYTSVEEDEAAPHLEARIPIDRLEVALDRLEVRLDRLERTVRWWIMVQMVGSMGWMALIVYLTHGGG